jgi:hypothetical protein
MRYLVTFTESYAVEADDEKEATSVASELSYLRREMLAEIDMPAFQGESVTVEEMER